MIQLSQDYVDSCPEEKGFRLRGVEMTRTEVFVDAAFAFAVTLLVISFDAIPSNWDEVVLAIKNIPAFVAAIGLLSVVAALLLPAPWTPFAGFFYALPGFWIPLSSRWQFRSMP